MDGSSCCICGKPLSRDDSINRGMGDICAGKYELFKTKPKKEIQDKSPESDYVYYIIEVGNKKVAIVIDKDTKGYMSVTNNIDCVCDDLGVKYCIYRDSEGVWDFWSEDTGFKSLALNGEANKNMDSAIEVAKSRFLGEIGGLFKPTVTS